MTKFGIASGSADSIDQWYVLDGLNPEPWESPEGSIQRKGGKMIVQMHKTFKLTAFQEDLKSSLVSAYPDIVMAPEKVDLRLEIFVWRNVDRMIKANIADATNMQKAIEDACQDILFKNDRQVRDVRTFIAGQGTDVSPAVALRLRTWDHLAEATLPLEADSRLDVYRQHRGSVHPVQPQTVKPDLDDSYF